MFKTLTLAVLAAGCLAAPEFIPRDTSGNVSCYPFVPNGRDTNQLKINFYDNNPTDVPYNGAGFHAETLPANATIASNGYLYLSNHTTSAGKLFDVFACNVTSHSLTTNTSQSSCSHSGCYHAYTNWVQIRNPATSHCLTVITYEGNGTALNFQKCDTVQTNLTQIFETTQYVNYPCCSYDTVSSYGTVELDLYTGDRNSLFEDWALSRKDNRTVVVVLDDYSQVGLSANLL